MTAIKFDYLFSIELLHKFYTDKSCQDFTITPTDQTRTILNGHNIIVKQNQNILYAGVRLDENDSPFPIPAEGTQWTFFLELNNPLFFNYTNLPVGYSPAAIFYFTNRNNNSSNGRQFLSAKISPFNVAATYKPGDLSLNATGTVFQAIRTNTGVAPPADNIASSNWMQVDAVTEQDHYISEADTVTLIPSISTYNFKQTDPPQTSADIRVWGYNTATADYTNLLVTKITGFLKPVYSFTLDLSALKAGKYKIKVNAEERLVYINDELSRRKVFAIIDIFNESTLPAACQLLNGSNHLLSPLFSIYFLNRSTIWKYIIASGAIADIQDNAGIYDFSIPASTIFSNSPIPLSEKSLNLTATIASQSFTPIACASPQRLTNHTSAGDVYYCSEIFLNQ